MSTFTTEDAWLEWRRGGIGGSDIAALLGISKYASPTSLYYDKLGLLPHREDSPRLRIGRRMEAVLSEEFHDRTGLFVVGAQTAYAHPDYPFARCTVDGFAAEAADDDDDAALATVEFKTDGRFGWSEIPPAIRAQCIWQMGVTQKPHAFLVVMFAGFRVETFEITFDNDASSDWDFMLTAASVFWDHVTNGEPPPVDGSEATTDALTEIFEPIAGTSLPADDHARSLVDDIRAATADAKAAEAEADRLKNELRHLLGDRTDLVDGYTPALKPIVLASWRMQTARRLDSTRLKREEPAIFERFVNEIESRVLRLH